MNEKRLTDDDKMPFGAHKGKRLGDVPDDYWQWFLQQYWAWTSYPQLVEYAKVVESDMIDNDGE